MMSFQEVLIVFTLVLVGVVMFLKIYEARTIKREIHVNWQKQISKNAVTHLMFPTTEKLHIKKVASPRKLQYIYCETHAIEKWTKFYWKKSWDKSAEQIIQVWRIVYWLNMDVNCHRCMQMKLFCFLFFFFFQL